MTSPVAAQGRAVSSGFVSLSVLAEAEGTFYTHTP
jgi:hypothetical protein